MIRLTTGVTRLNGCVLRPEDGAFEADRKTEEYLVGQGVAVYTDGTDPADIPVDETDAMDTETEIDLDIPDGIPTNIPTEIPEEEPPVIVPDPPKKAPAKKAAKK